MSYTSKQGGGSRNSDDDGRPSVSVKVGMRLLVPVVVLDHVMLIWYHLSCANPPTAATDRSRLRNHSSALSEIHGSRHFTNEPDNRLAKWTETLLIP